LVVACVLENYRIEKNRRSIDGQVLLTVYV
jgi:hypothetical protein